MNTNSKISLPTTTSSISYYFDLQRDSQINSQLVCRSAELFNKKSFYIDLDFDCDSRDPSSGRMYDIYGAVTDPEIC